MKKLFLIPFLMIIFMLNVASSCSDDDNDNSSADPTPVINTVTQGTWRVTNFTEDTTNHTSDFTGYNFTFLTDNTLEAYNGTNMNVGVWTITNDDDDSSSNLDFNIFFDSIPVFEELSEDWEIISRTDTKVVLTHVSGGDGSIDLLTFEKN